MIRTPPTVIAHVFASISLAVSALPVDSPASSQASNTIIEMDQKPRTQFLPDQPWPDNNGVHINAHGGGIMFYEGIYYWFGEHKVDGETCEIGVHCYSSKDLYNWKDEGIASPAPKS